MVVPNRYYESKQTFRYFSLYTYNVSTALNGPKKGYVGPMYVKCKSQLHIQKVLPKKCREKVITYIFVLFVNFWALLTDMVMS